MAFTDRVVQYPNRFRFTPVEGQENVYDVTRVEGTVTQSGTLLNAANLTKQINALINNKVTFKMIQRGSVTLTPTTAGETVSSEVTFPSAFTSTPVVIATPNTSVPQIVNVGVSGVSRTGFTMNMNRTSKTATKIYWIAMV